MADRLKQSLKKALRDSKTYKEDAAVISNMIEIVGLPAAIDLIRHEVVRARNHAEWLTCINGPKVDPERENDNIWETAEALNARADDHAAALRAIVACADNDAANVALAASVLDHVGGA